MKKLFCTLLAAALLLTLAACSKAPEADPADEASDWQTQYDLGVRYLSEGKYEEAILAFNAAIEIDPKNPDAYIKLAEVYEQTGDDEAALRTLQTGAEATYDSSLGLLAERKQKELDKADEPAAPAAETPVKLTRDAQIERLRDCFPAAVGGDCTEYVSYEPGMGIRPYEQPDDMVLYRGATVDGPDGPERYVLYGSSDGGAWSWRLDYARVAPDGTVTTGSITLPTMDIYSAQSDVVLYPGADGVWNLAVYNVGRDYANAPYWDDGPGTTTWEITAYTLGERPAQSGSWSWSEKSPSGDDWDTWYTFYEERSAARSDHWAQLEKAGLPLFPGDTSEENAVILSGEAARQTIWLYHCDHFVLGSAGSDTTHLRRDWSPDEMEAHEAWFRQEAEEAIEGEAMRARYKLELRPGMARTGTCVNQLTKEYEEKKRYGQFAIVDTQTGQDAALFYMNYREEDNEIQRAYPDNCTFKYVDGYCVYCFPVKEVVGGTRPNVWFSFDPETGKVFSLPESSSCMKAGKYLLWDRGGGPPSWGMITLQGEELNPDQWFEYWGITVRDGMLYYSFPAYGMGLHISTFWRMDLQSGATTYLGTVEAEHVYYICDTFALDYTQDVSSGAGRIDRIFF